MQTNGAVFSLIAATTLATSGAMADELQRWYGTASIGVGSLSSTTLTYTDGTTTSTASGDYDPSFSGGGALGYRFDNGWTLEGELMYRRNESDAVSLAGLGDFNEGDYASLAVGINALYRFDIGRSGKLEGYVGPGFVWLQEIDIDFDNDGQQEISFETDDTAWQFKVGGRYEFNERWFVDGSATYLMADGITMEKPDESFRTISSDYDHLTFNVGVGLRF